MMNIKTFVNEVEFLNTTAQITLKDENAEFIVNLRNGSIELDVTSADDTMIDLFYRRLAGYTPIINKGKLLIYFPRITGLNTGGKNGQY